MLLPLWLLLFWVLLFQRTKLICMKTLNKRIKTKKSNTNYRWQCQWQQQHQQQWHHQCVFKRNDWPMRRKWSEWDKTTSAIIITFATLLNQNKFHWKVYHIRMSSVPIMFIVQLSSRHDFSFFLFIQSFIYLFRGFRAHLCT